MTAPVASPASRTAGPLSMVLEEFRAGTPTVSGIARRTGLGEGVVRAAMDHLIRTGRVEAGELPIGCPPDGCGGCASSAGCPAVSGRKGLVTLTLSRRVA